MPAKSTIPLNVIQESNARISVLPEGLIALFIGATSGIGKSTLEQFAQYAVRPKVYIVARSADKIADQVTELRTRNPDAIFDVIEKDVSLISDTQDVVDYMKAREAKLDFLYNSAGFLPMSGRIDTIEGLEPSMTTRFYTKIVAANGLMSLLNAAQHPRVVSVLAGGQESPLVEDDLDLRTPGNFSLIKSSTQSATMLTLCLEHLAIENPKVSFIHSFPGFVDTPLFGRGSSGIKNLLLTWVAMPLILSLFAMKPQEAGARALFYLTSAHFSVDGGGVPVAARIGDAATNTVARGVFLLNEKSLSVGDEKAMEELRTRGMDKRVWEHTMATFENALASRN
ncbi:NAD(P)-binding protein [Xylariaceae sp. FL1272]|nr:NAD(P)-binding protein [Xylariaceae sp. FL1272]